MQERAVLRQPGRYGLFRWKHPWQDETSGRETIPTGRGGAAAWWWWCSGGGAQGNLRTYFPSRLLTGKSAVWQHGAWSSRAGSEVTPITRHLCCIPTRRTILTYRAQLKIDTRRLALHCLRGQLNSKPTILLWTFASLWSFTVPVALLVLRGGTLSLWWCYWTYRMYIKRLLYPYWYLVLYSFMPFLIDRKQCILYSFWVAFCWWVPKPLPI